MGILGSMVKAKSMELKSKTRELKTRLTIFWLLKDKKVLLGSNQHLSPTLQNLLTHHQAPPAESKSATQEEEEEEEEVEGMMRMMMSKQGIKLVKMYNKQKIAMLPVHTTTSTTTHFVDHNDTTTATAEEEEEDLEDQEEEQQEQEQQQKVKHDDDNNDDDDEEEEEEDVDLTLTGQPLTFVEDEGTTGNGYNYYSKGESEVMDEEKDKDDDHINIDEAADLFIRNFRRQLRLQKNQNPS